MAISTAVRGDIVILHSAAMNLHGAFVVDQYVDANNVYVFPLESGGIQAGGPKDGRLHIKLTDIWARHAITETAN
jgi:hypothetical protein